MRRCYQNTAVDVKLGRTDGKQEQFLMLSTNNGNVFGCAGNDELL